MDLHLTPSQLRILQRLARGEILWQRELPSFGNAAYFGDPPDPVEILSGEDVATLIHGEGPELGLLTFRLRGPGRALVGEMTELGMVYALRTLKRLG